MKNKNISDQLQTADGWIDFLKQKQWCDDALLNMWMDEIWKDQVSECICRDLSVCGERVGRDHVFPARPSLV